ncbi:hypothetical protein ACOME3_006198 [Neoechinorhynchus agilis]
MMNFLLFIFLATVRLNETTTNITCISFQQTTDWSRKGQCSSIVAWKDVFDSSNIIQKVLEPYFQIRPSYQCSFDPIELNLMLCSLIYPSCSVNNTIAKVKLPCKSTCFATLRNCWSLTPLLSCHLLPEDECLTIDDLSLFRSRQLKNKASPVLMEMLVPMVEDGHAHLLSTSDFVALERERIIQDIRSLFHKSAEMDKDRLYENLLSIAKRLVYLNNTVPRDLQYTDSIMNSMITAVYPTISISTDKMLSKNLTCTTELDLSPNREMKAVCEKYIAWDIWTDRSNENKQLDKYFELRPTYHCTFDPIEFNILLCISAYTPCNNNGRQLEICQDTCNSILRNCFPLTSVFKCQKKPTNSCVPIEDVNKYRSRYMRKNPPAVNMEISVNLPAV